MVLTAGPELIEDVRQAPENVLSQLEPVLEVSMAVCKTVNSCSQGSPQFLQPEYTLDLLNMNDEYHKDVIRSKLTRNIAVTFKEVREELVSALDDFLPTSEDSM
jgi:Trm5-related predicted tRNA methylase